MQCFKKPYFCCQSDGEPSTTTGKYSMLEFSMMYFRENLDRLAKLNIVFLLSHRPGCISAPWLLAK